MLLALHPFPDLSSSAPLERYAYAHLLQIGAGLYIQGTATLTSTNVYKNVATVMHLHSEPP